MNTPAATNSGMVMKASKPLLPLELWHAFDRASRGDNSLEFALLHWTCVWNFFPWHLSRDPAGAPVTERTLYRETWGSLHSIWDRRFPTRSHEAFVADARGILDPLVDEWVAEGRRHPPAERPGWGCFGYNVVSKDPACAALHFHNACWPRSPFEDMSELFDDLRQCLRLLRQAAPAVRQVSCASWINGLPRFQALFPRSYAAGLAPTDPDSKGFGWWGQFVRKDGALNETRADHLRRTGEFPFIRTIGVCALEDLATHVESGYSTVPKSVRRTARDKGTERQESRGGVTAFPTN